MSLFSTVRADAPTELLSFFITRTILGNRRFSRSVVFGNLDVIVKTFVGDLAIGYWDGL